MRGVKVRMEIIVRKREGERERKREWKERERERESLDALFQCESRLVGLERTRERRIIG